MSWSLIDGRILLKHRRRQGEISNRRLNIVWLNLGGEEDIDLILPSLYRWLLPLKHFTEIIPNNFFAHFARFVLLLHLFFHRPLCDILRTNAILAVVCGASGVNCRRQICIAGFVGVELTRHVVEPGVLSSSVLNIGDWLPLMLYD